jgi:hypothetical protein
MEGTAGTGLLKELLEQAYGWNCWNMLTESTVRTGLLKELLEQAQGAAGTG